MGVSDTIPEDNTVEENKKLESVSQDDPDTIYKLLFEQYDSEEIGR